MLEIIGGSFKVNPNDQDVFSHKLQLHVEMNARCTILETCPEKMVDKMKKIHTNVGEELPTGIFS